MRYYFELRKDKINKNKLIPIRLVVIHGKIRIRKNLEAKCLLENWDDESNLIVCDKKDELFDLYNRKIEITVILNSNIHFLPII